MIHDYIKLIGHEDWIMLGRVLGSSSRIFKPDVVLAPEGYPYLFRWYLMDEQLRGSVMVHFQVASDPERPKHDHPWANRSVILTGGYIEHIQMVPPDGDVVILERKVGDVVERPATACHRLYMPEGVPYTLTLFTTGPKVREWGFWYPDGWHHQKRHIDERASRGQVSVHVADKGEAA